jgi:hypothetical protein
MSRSQKPPADPYRTASHGTDPYGGGRVGSQVVDRTRSRAHESPEGHYGASERGHKDARAPLPLDRDNVKFDKDVGSSNDKVSQEAMKYIVAQLPRPKHCDTATLAKIRQVFFLQSSVQWLIHLTLLPASQSCSKA